MSDREVLGADDLIFSPLESAPAPNPEPDELKLSTLERNTILKVIEKHNGNITKAAKELGLTRTALYRRISKYEI
jgi:transcriptional regulator of acetoin/glycerol metabolism